MNLPFQGWGVLAAAKLVAPLPREGLGISGIKQKPEQEEEAFDKTGLDPCSISRSSFRLDLQLFFDRNSLYREIRIFANVEEPLCPRFQRSTNPEF